MLTGDEHLKTYLKPYKNKYRFKFHIETYIKMNIDPNNKLKPIENEGTLVPPCCSLTQQPHCYCRVRGRHG